MEYATIVPILAQIAWDFLLASALVLDAITALNLLKKGFTYHGHEARRFEPMLPS